MTFKPVIVTKSLLELPTWKEVVQKFEGRYADQQTLDECRAMIKNYEYMGSVLADKDYAKEIIEALKNIEYVIISRMRVGPL